MSGGKRSTSDRFLCRRTTTKVAFLDVKIDITNKFLWLHGEIVLKSLYDIFTDKTLNKKGQLLPPDYRPHGDYTIDKGSIDYLAGMMDTFANSQYEELKHLHD